MQVVVAVSAVPIAVAFIVGIGGFVALLPLLLADESRHRQPVAAPHLHVLHTVEEPALIEPAPVRLVPRASRLRLVATIGALLVWSVWSVRRPQDRGRHD